LITLIDEFERVGLCGIPLGAQSDASPVSTNQRPTCPQARSDQRSSGGPELKDELFTAWQEQEPEEGL
jgi:hypothetical protein|tara:strand:+ start:201 stop:404 length:204 start_codon:yes stop_codon:yes gene_type:complete